MRTDMCLQSHKWTWTPALLIIDTAKTNAYAQHVLLCDDFNRQHTLTHKDKQYARPLTAKQFYRILGLKMIKYKWYGLAMQRPESAGSKEEGAGSNLTRCVRP